MKKVLKVIGISLLSIVVIYLVLCLAGPSNMNTEKSTVIKASDSSIFAVVADFNTWKSWDPFNEMDNSIEQTITGEPTQVGHKNVWTSKKSGDGSQEIVEVKPYSYVKTELILSPGANTKNYCEFIIEPAEEGNKVTWTMKGPMPFMMRGMMLVMGMKKQLNKSYEKGLSNLKNKIEAQ